MRTARKLYSTASALVSSENSAQNGKSFARVRNEKIDCHRFGGMATQCVELLGTDIERIDIEAPSLSFLQEKIKR